MKHYKLAVKPHYVGRQKGFYSYDAFITCHEAGAAPRVVWSANSRLRRDVLVQGEEQRARYSEVARLEALSVEAATAQQARLSQLARSAKFTAQTARLATVQTSSGMLGRRHSEETKERIRQLVSQRHAEGAYKNCGAGRPTKAQSRERAKEKARALGVPLAVYLAQMAERKAALQRRREALSLSPEEARAAVVRKILSQG